MRFTALLAAAAALYVAPAAFADGYDDFTGNWRNDSPDGGLTRVQINMGGGGLRVRGFGECHPSDCDWGQVNAVAYSDNVGANPSSDATEVVATFNSGFSTTMLVLRRAGGDKLSFGMYTRFNDSRAPYVKHGVLRQGGGGGGGWPPGGGGGGGGGGWPPGGGGGGGGGGWPPGGGGGGGGGGLSFSEDCISFDWHDVHAQFAGGAWKVVQGSMWMLDYGSDHSNAERAADIIRNYRFNKQCYVGRPNPSMSYWKRGNDVPSGDYPGDDCTENNPSTTHAQFVGGEWKLVDGSHWLLSFGSNASEAHKAEELVHNYHLNRQCWVVRSGGGGKLNYWLSE